VQDGARERPETGVVVINESQIPLDEELLRARVEEVFALLGCAHEEVCVLCIDDDEMGALNMQWRQEEGATDVLSFSMREGESPELASQLPLGDIAVSVETAQRVLREPSHAARVAAELGVAPATLSWGLYEELVFLVIHGALHLLGHDHSGEEDSRAMRAEEARLMRRFLP